MSGTGIAVVAVLVLLSVWSLAVSVERTIVFARARRQSLAFARWLNESRRQDWLESALESAARYPHSHLARVVSAGLQTFQRKKARGTATKAEILEAADRALDRSAHRATAELRRGVGSLATIASTAPFIGLFGTVIGIIHAFQDIATHGNGGFEIVSKGIAEALVTTALGLVVAIPAAWMFNHLTQKVERLTLEMESSSSELLEFFVELEEGDAAAAG
jgi:biopolymer transport protein ExbB/biopolymer transport protein TolQ